MIKAIIFDLDDTLYDCTNRLAKASIYDACKAAIKAGLPVKPEDLDKFTEKIYKRKIKEILSFKECIRDFVEELVKDRALAEKIINEAKSAYYNDTNVGNIALFPGAKEMLLRLKKKYKLFLVTLGNIGRQKAKIKKLGIENMFDKILYIRYFSGIRKKEDFKKIAYDCGLAPEEIAVIGDRIDSEIEDAKQLGMRTILCRTGEHAKLKPENDFEKPDFTVKDIAEVEKIIENL